MALRHIARASVGFLFLVATAVAQHAYAQNGDGSGQIRFGVFLQGNLPNLNVKEFPPGGGIVREQLSPDSIGGGVSAGYDQHIGNFVLGGEMDVAYDNGRAVSRAAGAPDDYSTDYTSTLRGRFGYQLTPNMLAYFTTGIGMQAITYRYSGTTGVQSSLVGGVFNTKTANMFGLSLGGGLEYDAGWGIVFGEYLHNDYGSQHFLNYNGNFFKIDADGDLIRLGLKFKVGYDYDHDDYVRPARSADYGLK